jgi:hypothetical protein
VLHRIARVRFAPLRPAIRGAAEEARAVTRVSGRATPVRASSLPRLARRAVRQAAAASADVWLRGASADHGVPERADGGAAGVLRGAV